MNKDTQVHLKTLPTHRVTHYVSIHNLITSLFPNVIVDMSYGMPACRQGNSQSAPANQKNHLSPYTCSASHTESCRRKYPQQQTGKGCINFRHQDEIHLDDLEAVIKPAIEHPEH